MDEFRAMAVEMLGLDADGAPFTLYADSEGEYDPEIGLNSGGTTEHNGTGFRSSFDLSQVDGERIQSGDVMIIVSPEKLDGSDIPTPKSGDRCSFAGDTYTVVSVQSGNFTGLNIYFMVHGRRA